MKIQPLTPEAKGGEGWEEWVEGGLLGGERGLLKNINGAGSLAQTLDHGFIKISSSDKYKS